MAGEDVVFFFEPKVSYAGQKCPAFKNVIKQFIFIMEITVIHKIEFTDAMCAFLLKLAAGGHGSMINDPNYQPGDIAKAVAEEMAGGKPSKPTAGQKSSTRTPAAGKAAIVKDAEEADEAPSKAAPAEALDPEGALDLSVVRALMQKKVQEGFQPKVKEILKDFQVTSIMDVDPDEYPAIVRRFNDLV